MSAYIDGPNTVEASILDPGQHRYLVYALEVDPDASYGTALGASVSLRAEQGPSTSVRTCFAIGVTSYPACSGGGNPEVPDLSDQMDGLCTPAGVTG